MSDQAAIGTVGWMDLSVEDAESIRDFYQDVVGWQPEACDMGDYSDYSMKTADGTPVAGVCHARGGNAGLPAQWLFYVTIADLDASIARAQARGGSVVVGPKNVGEARYAVIRDPAGAVFALYQGA